MKGSPITHHHRVFASKQLAQTLVKYPLALCLISVALFLSACSDDNVDTSGQSAADQANNDSFQNGWRSGTLQIQFKFAQKGEISETEENGGLSKAKWNHSISASLQKTVMVAPDLQDYLTVTEGSSAEQRLRNLRSSVLSELDTKTKPIVKGNFKYHNDFISHNPSLSGTDWLREQSSGRGVITNLDLINFQISRYGMGYEFELGLTGKGKERAAVSTGDSEADMAEDLLEFDTTEMVFEDKFSVFPKADRAIFNLYAAESSLNRSQTTETQFFDVVEQLSDLGDDAYNNSFVPAVTKASKDKLVVRFKHNGQTIKPRHAGMLAEVAKPAQNNLEIVVLITADKK